MFKTLFIVKLQIMKSKLISNYIGYFHCLSLLLWTLSSSYILIIVGFKKKTPQFLKGYCVKSNTENVGVFFFEL